MQNRGISFSLDRNALNVLEPGRLPLHTLCAALAVLRDGRVMAYGSMGGDAAAAGAGGRVQPPRLSSPTARPGHRRAALVCRQDLGKPIGNLVVEARLDGNLIERLMSAGHDVVLTDAIGHAGAVVLHPDGQHGRRARSARGRRSGGV